MHVPCGGAAARVVALTRLGCLAVMWLGKALPLLLSIMHNAQEGPFPSPTARLASALRSGGSSCAQASCMGGGGAPAPERVVARGFVVAVIRGRPIGAFFERLLGACAWEAASGAA